MRAEIHLTQHALVEFTKEPRSDVGKPMAVVGSGIEKRIWSWGAKNDLPTYRENILQDNNIMGEMINTKRSIILGNGLQFYKEEFADGEKKMIIQETPPEIADWMEEYDFSEKYLEPAANDLFMHGNIFAPISVIVGKAAIMTYKCRDMRIVEKALGKPHQGFVMGTWSKKIKPTERYFKYFKPLPSELTNLNGEYIYHTGDRLFNDDYYCSPVYWGGSEWR